MERTNQPGDYRENRNTDPEPVCALPEELQARLDKADDHINAAGKKLWYETDRGFWSADQAKARLAEVWLWLHGEPVEPLPLDRYLKKEVMGQCLQVWARTEVSAPIAAALAELATAEQTVRTEPFPTDLSTPLSDAQREVLCAGIDREYQYKKALYGLQVAVEDVVAERYVNLRPGDWVRLNGREVGRVLAMRGLTIDRGEQGILEATMFHLFVQRISAPADVARLTFGPWHRRWRDAGVSRRSAMPPCRMPAGRPGAIRGLWFANSA